MGNFVTRVVDNPKVLKLDLIRYVIGLQQSRKAVITVLDAGTP